jgi:hypothetical protein
MTSKTFLLPDVFGALAFRAGFDISALVPIFSFGIVFSGPGIF